MLELYAECMVAPFCVIAFGCTEESAHDFSVTAASQYLDNPYHGPIHAAQVSHLSRWLTKAMKVMDYQSELETAAFMLGAFCHDIKHIGKNNNFCVMSEHPLALLYNNARVLENFHSSCCLELLESKEVLKGLNLKDRKQVRTHIIENILATDMAEHFETISKFRVRREQKECNPELEDDRRFLSKLCLKAGDLGHGALNWSLHVPWSTRIVQEFYAQGDEERRLGLPISALCDKKDADNLAKSQKGFLDFVVTPMMQVMSESQPYLQNPDKEEPQPPQAKHSLRLPEKKPGQQRRVSSAPMSQMELQIEYTCIEKIKQNVKNWMENKTIVTEVKAQLGLDCDTES
jgi:hypothetical protein